MPGQGLYFNTLTNTWRAKNCDVDSYGVSSKTYGLSPAACRDCPSGQVATTAAGYPVSASFYVDNGDGTKGFISVKTCVNKPGVSLAPSPFHSCPLQCLISDACACLGSYSSRAYHLDYLFAHARMDRITTC